MKCRVGHSRIKTEVMRMFVLICLMVSTFSGPSLRATEGDSDRPQHLAKLSDFDLRFGISDGATRRARIPNSTDLVASAESVIASW
jgi:hypothetical protein